MSGIQNIEIYAQNQQVIHDNIAPQARPDLCLVWVDHEFFDRILDLMCNFQGSDAAKAEKNGIGNRSVKFLRKLLPISRCHLAEFASRGEIQPINI